MSLLSLPPEMIEEVCKLLCNYCQTEPLSYFPQKDAVTTPCLDQIWEHDAQRAKALINLSETCQALNTITLPHRYHRIKLNSDILGTKEFIAHIRGCGHNALDHVRSLSLDYTLTMKRMSDGEKHGFTFFSMVLLNMPKIQLLHISSDWEYEVKISHRIILASLRYLHIERYNISASHSLRISDLLRQAPKIDTLVIQITLWTPSTSYYSGISGLENVKCLKFVDTLVDPWVLTKILESCPQLESFVCNLFADMGRRLEYRADHFTSLSYLPEILSVRQQTLRYIELYWQPPPPGIDPGMNIAGSFKALTNLETLILGGRGLRFEKAENETTLRTCLVNLLPRSIRSVTIDSDRISLHEPILALGEAVKLGSFPMLKEVRCYSWDEGELKDLMFERLSAGGPTMTRQKFRDWLERNKSSPLLLSQLSRTCNVSFSAESKGLFEQEKVSTAGRLWCNTREQGAF